MTTQERRELLAVLDQLGDAYPEMRLGQLIANLSYLAKEPSNEAVWEVEDDALLAAARQLLSQRAGHRTSVA